MGIICFDFTAPYFAPSDIESIGDTGMSTNPSNFAERVMRKFVLITLVSLFAAAALPANATLADRKSDEGRSEQAQPAPYSGQIVIRGEIQDRDAEYHAAKPAPYSGQIVIRGQVQPESHG